MAKLAGPLFSLAAVGKIADTLVYFGWKGLNVVRQYVVPTNPKSTAQQLQRGYLTAAVARIHVRQADADHPFGADDAIAYALLGALQPTPRTWFNTVCKQWMDQKVAGKIPCIYMDGSCVAGSLKLTLLMHASPESGGITNGRIHYGTSKSALSRSIACTYTDLSTGKDIPNLTKGLKYFVQFRPNTPTSLIGSNSGIWHGIPIA